MMAYSPSEASSNAKILDVATEELRAITGQKPVITKAKKSIAAFKLREGMNIGAMVTLRGDRMSEFLDRLISVALPRVRGRIEHVAVAARGRARAVGIAGDEGIEVALRAVEEGEAALLARRERGVEVADRVRRGLLLEEGVGERLGR